ncbi:cytochrome b [Chenggangzhangella methanolivorans]|uniref:Cytochrome b n=1 Tax=Chenggangzhangella methanolivorans TaxID=1437009 RepID=A0A9E6UJM1_9HYPH|nr:cytochrome b [Chenggangzhangella methanolivorans]QZN98261.1 cytochrome b [Chenggangzhangella methanolivorans]
MASITDAAAIPGRSSDPARYDGVSQALHWLVALAMLAVLPLAWLAEAAPKEDAGYWMFFHKSVGVLLLVLMVTRSVWRARRPAPAPQPGPFAGLARATHWALYAALLAMPISGYLMSGSGKPVPFFFVNLPGLPESEALKDAMNFVHVNVQWAVYALILAHVAGAAYHVAVRRDGLLDRMLPRQNA